MDIFSIWKSVKKPVIPLGSFAITPQIDLQSSIQNKTPPVVQSFQKGAYPRFFLQGFHC